MRLTIAKFPEHNGISGENEKKIKFESGRKRRVPASRTEKNKLNEKMVQVFAICVMRHNGFEVVPIMLCSEYELSTFGFFKRGTVKELMTFFGREVVQRTRPGDKNVVDQGDYVCHSYVSGEHLGCAIVTDKDYPTRVGLSLAALVLQEFKAAHPDDWVSHRQDVQLATPNIQKLLEKYQKPEVADNISKIQKDLDEVKDILHQSMEDLLKRGERLETIIEKSDDLSASSKQFLWQAKKNNECCSYT